MTWKNMKGNRTPFWVWVLLLLAAVFIMVALRATGVMAQTIVSEWRTDKPTYTIVADGLNYDSDNDGTADTPSDATLAAVAGAIEVTGTGLPFSFDNSGGNAGEITFTTRDGVVTTLDFGRVVWFNKVTRLWTDIDTSAAINDSISGDKILLPSIYPGIDAEIISTISGPIIDYIITDMTGWTPNPYGTDGVLAFHHPMKVRGHNVKVDGVTWNGTDYVEGEYITWEGTSKEFYIVQTEATDAAGDTSPVTNVVFDGAGQDFYAEAVDATWLSTATLPVRMHYATKTGSITADETWSGEVGVTGNVTISPNGAVDTTVTVDPGTIIKVDTTGGIVQISMTAGGGAGLGILDVNGTAAQPVYITSCNDDSVGVETITECSSTGTPAAGDWGRLDVNEGSLLMEHTHVRYADLGVRVYLYSGIQGPVSLDYVYIYENEQYCLWAAEGNTPGAGGSISVTNSMFMSTNVLVYTVFWNLHNSLNSVLFSPQTFKNNLVTHVGYDAATTAGGVIWRYYETATVNIENNTIASSNNVACLTMTETIATNDTAINNQCLGNSLSESGFVGSSGSPTNSSNNNCDATIGGTCFTSWATELTLTQTKTTGDHEATYDPLGSSTMPSSLWDFHLSDSDPLIDAGSQSASAAGLGSTPFHTTTDGNLDTGTVDIGFHYPLASHAGGGGGGGGGGSPTTPPFGGGVPPWGVFNDYIWDSGDPWGYNFDKEN